MGNFKIVAVDMDGTVLNKEKKISEENIKALNLCKEKGILVVPVTGRPASGMYEEYIRDIGCRYSINSNGAVVMDFQKKTEIITHSLNMDTTEKILDIIEEFDCYCCLFYKGYGYLLQEKYDYELSRFADTPMYEYVRKTRVSVENQREFLKKIDHCDNIYVIAKTTEIRDEICKAIEDVTDIFYTCSFADDIEIGGNCSKGGTLLELGELLGISREEILAIGDSGNDVNMLEMAGFGVAMGDGSEAVKNCADYVTKSCEENGVAFAIHKFCL